MLTFKQKNYKDWSGIKSKIHNEKQRPDFCVGEVWYCSFGDNIGYEIDGKNSEGRPKLYLRPVLILQATSKDTFVGIPLTSKTEKYINKAYAAIVELNGKENAILFGQVKSMDTKRLQSKMYRIRDSKLSKIKQKFIEYILIPPKKDKKITPKQNT
jgi:mRNA-degrading endonuclease toxin of MazEF toxin-antitoxin module